MLAVALPAGLIAVLPLVMLDGLIAPASRAFARAALVSTSRPSGLLRETNALANVIFTANGFLAPALGGVLVAGVGPSAALQADAASFLAAAFLIGRIPITSATQTERGCDRLRGALKHVRERPVLRGLLAGDALTGVFVMAITPIEVVYVTDTLHAGNRGLGIVLAAWGVGMIAGGIAAARLRTTPLPALLGLAALGPAVGCLGMGVSASLAPVVAWSAVGGVGNGMYGMAFVTAVQERTADAFQARVGALHETLTSVSTGLGYALGGAIAVVASPRAVYLVAGCGGLAVLAWTAANLRGADWSGCANPHIAPDAAQPVPAV